MYFAFFYLCFAKEEAFFSWFYIVRDGLTNRPTNRHIPPLIEMQKQIWKVQQCGHCDCRDKWTTQSWVHRMWTVLWVGVWCLSEEWLRDGKWHVCGDRRGIRLMDWRGTGLVDGWTDWTGKRRMDGLDRLWMDGLKRNKMEGRTDWKGTRTSKRWMDIQMGEQNSVPSRKRVGSWITDTRSSVSMKVRKKSSQHVNKAGYTA